MQKKMQKFIKNIKSTIVVRKLLITMFILGISLANTSMAAEGDISITPINTNADNSQNLDVEIIFDAGAKNLQSFNFIINFDNTDITVDLTQGEDPGAEGGKGFHKGSDTASYSMLSNSSNVDSGELRITGYTSSPTVTGSGQHLAIIHLKTADTFNTGDTILGLTVVAMEDEDAQSLATGAITGATVTYQDLTAPVLTEITTVTTPTNDTTPDYTFSSTEVGTITYGGSCGSADTSAVSGNNTVTFNALANGTYNDCTITVTDTATNSSSALAVTSFTVDDTVPTVTEITPITTPANSVRPTYVYSYLDNTGFGTPDWGGSCNGYFPETAGSIGAGNNATSANADMPEGVYNDCTLTITDDGTAGSAIINVTAFTIDTTAPVAAEVTVVPTPSNNTTPDYTFSSTEVGTIAYGGDCSSTTTAAVSGDNTITFDALADGAHSNCTITVTDAAGNDSNVISVTTFTVDTTAPVISEVTVVTTPTNDTTPDYTFNTSEAGTISYTGDCSSATTAAVSGDNTITFDALADGEHSNCTITVTDGGTNSSNVLSVATFTVDNTAPTATEVIVVTTPNNNNTPSITLNFSEHVDSLISSAGCMINQNSNISSGNQVFTISIDGLGTGLAEGDYGSGATNCYITSITDDAGNVNAAQLDFSQFTIDTTAPIAAEVTVVPTPSNDATPDYTFSSTEVGTITYGGDCSSATTAAVSGDNTITFDALADGAHSNCTITVTDAANNASNTVNVTAFTVDAAVPVISETTAVPTPANDTTPDYTFNASEAGTISYTGDCSSATTAAVLGDNTVTFNALAEGEHNNCTVMITDAGTNASNVLNVAAFTVDTTAPVAAEVTVVPTPTNDSTPDYTFSSTEVGTITYGGDCSSATTAAVSGDNTITFNALVNGAHSNCTVAVTDNAGNISNVQNVTAFTVDAADTTAPTVSEVTINIFTNDNTPDYTFYSSEAGTITYGGDCSSAATNATTGNNTITFNALADGVYSNCTIVVTDAASNASAPLAVSSFTVDTTAPVLSGGAPIGIQSAGTTQVTISLATDETSNCRYSTTPGVAYTAMTPASFSLTGGSSHSTLVTGLTNGNTYTYYVRCANLSGTANDDDYSITFSVADTCTSFTYSSWGTCQASNTQTRTIVSSSPASCTGGVPVTTQSCTYAGGSVDADTNFNDFTPKLKLKGLKKKYKLDRKKKIYLKKKKLSFSGTTVELIGGKVQLFIDGDMKDESMIDSNGDWKVSAKVKKRGSHKIRFKYFDSAGNFVGESSKYKIKLDTRKPRFVDLPGYMTKRVGDKVNFEATDTKSKKTKAKKGNKIKYYKYYFLGKKHKTKDPYFIIPAGTPKGLHTLKVRAYDKAGNKAKKTVVINVR